MQKYLSLKSEYFFLSGLRKLGYKATMIRHKLNNEMSNNDKKTWIIQNKVGILPGDQGPIPTGIFLPGTELLQSQFRTEFSMGSCSQRYRRFLRRHRRFLRSCRRFLRSCRRSRRRFRDRRPRGRRRRSLRDSLKIIKHC